MTTQTKPLAFRIGERVCVTGQDCKTVRRSRVVEFRYGLGLPGKVLYVLEDGGFLDESELESLENRELSQ